ncbi:aldo/keto reductase, partial [Isoptericola chiayiensis]
TETGVTPAVNQIELHPYFPQADQRAYDTAHGIVTQAWSPIGRANELLRDPVLTGIAEDHGVSVVQVILAWHTRLGVLPIPKASSPDRQRQNLEAATIELSDAEVDRISGLGRPDGRTADQDPAVYEEL